MTAWTPARRESVSLAAKNSNTARSLAIWPPQKIAELTRLYVDEGLTMIDIGQRMDIGKNAVIGKVNRLGLVRGAGFVPSIQQAGRLRAEELREPASTLHSRLDALHATFDAARLPDPPRLKLVKATDNAMRPMQRAAR